MGGGVREQGLRAGGGEVVSGVGGTQALERVKRTVLQPGDRLHVDAYGNLHIAVALGAASHP